MEHARCIEDGVVYSAVNFVQQLPDDFDRKRNLLQCPECGGAAFFRHASPIGRAACFGARPHAQGCQLAAQDLLHGCSADEKKGGNRISGSKIIIDFRYGATISPDRFCNMGRLPIQERASCNFDHPHTHVYRQRLGSLLRDLIETPVFSNSDQIIKIEGRGELTARNFFVPLKFAAFHLSGHFKGYWGVISDAKLALDKSLWFNSCGNDNINFCLDSKYVDAILERYNIMDFEEISGAYILVLGTPRVSHNGKLFCVIEGTEHMALRLT